MTTHMPMAPARQPFAPLDTARLQTLTSLKNRQNALPNNTRASPIKRKAHSFDDDDAENIDPIIFLSPKRSKNPDGSSKDTVVKPSQFYLTRAPPSPDDCASAFKPATSYSPAPANTRPALHARSPVTKINHRYSSSAITKPSPLSAPAGRSPTRKRVGILNRRRTAGPGSSPFTHIDPPRFGGAPGASANIGLGFSIDAALSASYAATSTIQAHVPVSSLPKHRELPVSLHGPEVKDSWFFDIHEDTPEELATNLMEHSTCTLDISSDEESAAKMKDERGKENVPPMDDISQTRTMISALPASLSSSLPSSTSNDVVLDSRPRHRGSRRSSRKEIDDDAIEVDRAPLGEMLAEDFYPEGCDGSSVFVILATDAEGEEADVEVEHGVVVDVPESEMESISPVLDGTSSSADPSPVVIVHEEPEPIDVVVDELMQKNDEEAAPAALLCPIEKPEENFEVWESGSAKGDDA
ncbi:hypothetical protein F5884DRAFT_678596 [Xylogone sp. PMI_703]|nr:hypothetical protein F5884DRAFT_678596 [Xylogone sp. PMI_703]